jgi:F-type H+-transporting ATPase subunit delta
MIGTTERSLARKYAAAFLQSPAGTVSLEHILQLQRIVPLLYKGKACRLLFLMPAMQTLPRTEVADMVLAQYALPLQFKDLLLLLIEHHRFDLLPAVTQEIVTLYMAEHNITPITIRTSAALTTEQLQFLVQFVEKECATQVYAQMEIDPTLIAGIRIEAPTFTWEQSIAGNLRILKESMRNNIHG